MDGDATRFAQAMTQGAEAFGPAFLRQAVDISNAIQAITSGPLSQSRL
jgi:hypothetical protein